jgi:hypothetical protein
LDHDAIAPHRKNLLRILPKDLTLEGVLSVNEQKM